MLSIIALRGSILRFMLSRVDWSTISRFYAFPGEAVIYANIRINNSAPRASRKVCIRINRAKM